MALLVNFTKYLTFQELISVFHNLLKTTKKEEAGPLSISSYDTSITLLPKPDKDITVENYRQISLMNICAKILNKILGN